MASWFNVDSIKGLTENLTEKVQGTLAKIDTDDMLEKLTLTTPELTAERHRIDQEEKQKERVKNMLAGILPWETRDPERDILVEECKEAILQLSSDERTFYGPYRMPEKAVKVETASSVASGDEEDIIVDDEDVVAKGGGGEEDSEEPPSESLEKLAKLEPLPILLKDFDLDAHVGLINRLLKEDPQLVEMQSSLSGGGERERIFWHNYFFHCAYTRYEAGLSIDEIWSDQPPPPPPSADAAAAAAAANAPAASLTEEETITFDHHDHEPSSEHAEGGSSAAADAGGEPSAASDGEPGGDAGNAESAPTSHTSSDYELVAAAEASGAPDDDIVGGSENDGGDQGEDEMGEEDYELDELEAEIARELED